nr:protein NRT1/ PTR FAMILY 4.6-like [Tanacetum cinerariifolium]
MNDNEPNKPTSLSNSLKFLNRAAEYKPSHKSLECSVQEVEDVKIMIHILPIFACTIILNCCLAQLSTFSVHQASTMNTMLGSFKVPPGSLPVFPITFMMIMVPLYDHVIIPHVRKWTKTETGVSHLQRAGIGLCFSILAMVVAALVETKRKKVANEHGLDNGRLPISFLWLAFQYLFLGSADLFVLAGLMEFAFSEAPIRMRSLATSFSWASLALGYYLSGVIVSLVNSVTGSGKHHHPWLSGENLNHYRLDRMNDNSMNDNRDLEEDCEAEPNEITKTLDPTPDAEVAVGLEHGDKEQENFQGGGENYLDNSDVDSLNEEVLEDGTIELKRTTVRFPRKYLGLDGCFLKGVVKGMVLTAHLKIDVKTSDGQEWTFMSDKQKGLLNAVQELFPQAEHRLCARHIYANWYSDFRAIKSRARDPLDYFDNCYSKDRFVAAYSYPVEVMGSEEFWPNSGLGELLPPLPKSMSVESENLSYLDVRNLH